MGKKDDYSKLFGGKTKAKSDFKVKSKKKNRYDIFMNDSKKKKKKKKPDKVEKAIMRAVGSADDDSILNLLVWEKVTNVKVNTLEDISKICRGLFVIDVAISHSTYALIPIMVDKTGEILHAETGDSMAYVFANMSKEEGTELTEIDIQAAEDTINKANIVKSLYNVNTTKLMESIRMLEE